jgi:hypothetical protein
MSNDDKDKKRDIASSHADTSPIEATTTTTTTTTTIRDKDKKNLILGIYQEQALPKE